VSSAMRRWNAVADAHEDDSAITIIRMMKKTRNRIRTWMRLYEVGGDSDADAVRDATNTGEDVRTRLGM